MHTDVGTIFDAAHGASNAIVKRTFNVDAAPSCQQPQPQAKAPIGVATMDSRGILVLELRLINGPRQTQPMHYWPGMPDYLRVVQHIGIIPGQTKFVYPWP